METHSSWYDRVLKQSDMIQELEKKPKVALCRKCRGTGKYRGSDTLEERICEQCEGSGRVTVSAKMTFDIRPYKPIPKQ